MNHRVPAAGRQRDYRYLNVIISLFIACLITANITSIKLVQISGPVFPASLRR